MRAETTRPSFFGCCCAFCFSSDCFPFCFIVYFLPMHSTFSATRYGGFVLCLMMLALVYSRILFFPPPLLSLIDRFDLQNSRTKLFSLPSNKTSTASFLLRSLTLLFFGVWTDPGFRYAKNAQRKLAADAVILEFFADGRTTWVGERSLLDNSNGRFCLPGLD
jgi:hypothetical protein